ncbi:MAG: site-specific integrase [Gemmatimonadetes bacterium]|nr:site-specific integrase [Gemmatimonadota bacterium]
MSDSPKKRRSIGSILPRYRGTGEDRVEIPNSWLVRVTTGVDRHGKAVRVNRVFKGSKIQAERFLVSLLNRQEKKQLAPGAMRLHEWLEEYDRLWSEHLAPSTRLRASQSLHAYLPDRLWGIRLRDLTRRDFQELYTNLLRAGKAPGTIRYLHAVLRARLNKAVEEGHLGVNPLPKGKDLPKLDPGKYVTLSADQARTFLEVASEDRWSALWHLLLLTGMRPGEALGLRWSDIVDENIQISRSLTRLRSRPWKLGPTKTGQGRTIPLPGPAARALQSHRARQARIRLALGAEYRDHGFIFACETIPQAGEPLHWDGLTHRHLHPILRRTALRILGRPESAVIPPGTSLHEAKAIRRDFKASAAEALRLTGLEGFKPYNLRHTAATLLLTAREHPNIVAKLLGHANPRITLEVYSRVTSGLVEEATTKLGDIIAAPDGRRDTG